MTDHVSSTDASHHSPVGSTGLSPRVLIYIIAALSAVIIFGGGCLLWEMNKDRVTVRSFSPVGEVAPGTNFTITFSKELVPDSVLNRPLDDVPVSISPRLPGRFEWIATDKLRFYPEVRLAPATEYTVEISPRIAADTEYALRGERAFTVRTPLLTVQSALLTFEFTPESNTRATLVSTIEFNYPVDPEEATRYVRVEHDEGERIPYRFRTSEPSTVLELEAPDVPRGDREKQIRLAVGEGLKPVGGSLGLPDTFVEPVLLPGQQDLKVYQATPLFTGGTAGSVRLAFNIPIDPATAREYLSVEPEVDLNVTASHFYLNLRGGFTAGNAYRVTVREGMPAIDGSRLQRTFSTTVQFLLEDIDPQVDFAGSGFYLTRRGNLNLGLATINVDAVELEIEKVFANNLVHLVNQTTLARDPDAYWYYYGGPEIEAFGTSLATVDLDLSQIRNQEVVTPIRIEDYLDGDRVGIYRLTAREKESRWNSASRWVVATNIGLVAKRADDDLWIWANDLQTLAPVSGAELKLFSRNSQLLRTLRTDAEGLAVFENVSEEDFPPYLVTAEQGRDLSFVELDERLIPTSDFDVDGMPYLTAGYDAFVYNERGVYRPGETAHLAAMVRGPRAAVPAPFPVQLEVRGPDGRILTRQRAGLDEQGMADFAADVPDFARTGRYSARLLLGDEQEIGRTSFSVEEFIPDRMKVALDTDQEAYAAGEQVRIDVEAMTLFGPPAAGRRVEANLELEPFVYTAPDYPAFSFTDDTRSFSPDRVEFDAARLDDDGRYSYTYTLPSDLDPPSAVRGVISSTVLEPGGRGVTAYRGVLVHPHRTYVGVRSTEQGYARPDRPRGFEFVVVSPEGGSLANRRVEVALHRIYYNSILKNVDGRYRYVSERVEEVEERSVLTSGNGPLGFSLTPSEYGQYRVSVRDLDAGSSASLLFYASGWGFVPWSMDAPERIEIDLDKESYRPGERARAQIRSPFPGKLLLTVERDGIFERQVVEVPENTATVDLAVQASWQPNVYVSAHLVRSTRGLDRDTPVRAFGVVPLMVDTSDRTLGIELDVPAEIRPNNTLTVNFRVQNASENRPTLTIAAVDEGILQLTDFQTPDPLAHFFGKKRLGVTTSDIYDQILPEISPRLSSPAGDVETARKRQLSPQTARRVKPVAFWSGLVETDGRGRGRVSFQIPSFNGTVRVMAVASAGSKFAGAEAPVLVRDPIVLTPTFPRVIGSGDGFLVPVGVFNGTGAQREFDVALEAVGPIVFEGPAAQTVRVPDGREEVVYFRVRAENAIGVASFRVRAEGGGTQSEMDAEVPVRPPVPLTTRGGSGSASPDAPASLTLPGDFIEGTTSYRLSVSSVPALEFGGGLQYLLQYPHGCIEQTTSRLFPLLAFDDVARVVAPAMFRSNGADYFIEEGIAKLESLQLSSGAFSYWPNGGYSNDWASIYAAHFLIEARRAGYVVSDRVYGRMLDALRGYARQYRGADAYSYQPVVYAAYALALAGQADRSTMNFLKNSVLDRLSTYSQYQLAGAYGLAGDRQTALSLLPQTLDVDERVETGGYFNSPDRARAVMLDVLAEIAPNHSNVPVLMRQLSESYRQNRRWSNTQTNAYAFLAFGKILAREGDPAFTGLIEADGAVVGRFDQTGAVFTSPDWRGADVRVSVEGTGTAYFTWQAEGLPSTQTVDEYDRDLVVRRRYLRENGSPIIDLSQVRQGELVIAEISIQAPNRDVENVAIVDLMPNGFEIENPRLESRQDVGWIGEDLFRADYMDIRDDRMLVYGDVDRGPARKFYYGVRAVTAGTFRVPPVRAEAMYHPETASVASSGRLTIRPVSDAAPAVPGSD